MGVGLMTFGLSSSEQFLEQLAEKDFRDEFVADQVRSRIAMLIRTLREQRGMLQSELGAKMGKPQSVVSRLEDPDYGKVSLQTLLEIAAAFDLPLIVDIPEWEEWLGKMGRMTKSDLRRTSFDLESFKERARLTRTAIQNHTLVIIGRYQTTTSTQGDGITAPSVVAPALEPIAATA